MLSKIDIIVNKLTYLSFNSYPPSKVVFINSMTKQFL